MSIQFTTSLTARQYSYREEVMGIPTLCVPALLALGLSAALTASTASAQSFPSQDVHFVVGFAAGSGPDTIARFVADKIRPMLNRPIVVENKVGAVGNIATEHVARAKPDGH